MSSKFKKLYVDTGGEGGEGDMDDSTDKDDIDDISDDSMPLVNNFTSGIVSESSKMDPCFLSGIQVTIEYSIS